MTEALYDAIEEYGSVARLKRYVLWRDFDLMWSVERDRYSPFPYPGTPQIRKSRHIQYVVVSEWMRERVAQWVPGVPVAVLPNRFAMTHPDLCPRDRFRRAFGIPEDAFLIARCTRVIPQKCIERDLRWIQALREELRALSDERDVFLFITGPVSEDPVETARLRTLAHALGLGHNVVWGDGLQPFNPLVRRGYPDGFSIADLLHASDLSSFLTSFGFEGFGNPPGEAMAMGVPYVATSYELYDEIYGNHGAVAPILPVSRSSSCSDSIPRSFIVQTLRWLVDSAHRRAVIEQNNDVCRRHFSLDLLERDIERLLQLDRAPTSAFDSR